jgi:hypothetical protein
MRRLFLLTTLLVSACSSPSPFSSDPEFASVRDHLTRTTELAIAPASSGGTINASHYTHDGWIGGDVPLVIESGEVTAQADEHGQLQISRLRVALAPIAVSKDVISAPTQLDHLQLDLEKAPVVATTEWTGGDRATATTELALQLSWSVTIDGTTSALGPQHLPVIPAAITVGGDPDSVDATFTLDLDGSVWGWAGLIDIRDLRLVLDTSSN